MSGSAFSPPQQLVDPQHRNLSPQEILRNPIRSGEGQAYSEEMRIEQILLWRTSGCGNI